jgi:hypothetical protein
VCWVSATHRSETGRRWHYQALRVVRERIGLDYFGIDCGLDPGGNLIVFEVNASMLVHDDNAEFPYKDPFVCVIKAAFGARPRRPRPAHAAFGRAAAIAIAYSKFAVSGERPRNAAKSLMARI